MAEEKNEDQKKTKKQKRPTALKRNLQSERRKLANRSFKATVQTAIRGFKDSLSKNDKTAAKAQLQTVYSLMDKGVKAGIFKCNKASRTKSRLSHDFV
jgi:small subunit ribosomal protein S20